MKNRFLVFWSLISPSCLALIGGTLWLTRLSWLPTSNIQLSIIIYLAYWILLGSLQAALLLKFQHKKLAYQWFLTTSTTGFLIMLCHDLSAIVLGVDTRGQGILYLLLSLPVLAIFGGLILGFAQFFLLKGYHQVARQRTDFIPNWFAVSFLSWIISFASILFGSATPFAIIGLATLGTAIKGYAVMKYLQLQV